MKNNMDIDWANIVDVFASEYGWTVDYIKTLDLGQIILLREQIHKRYEAQNGESPSESTGASITETNSEMEFVQYLEKNVGAKRKVRKDGTVELVL